MLPYERSNVLKSSLQPLIADLRVGPAPHLRRGPASRCAEARAIEACGFMPLE